MDALHTFSKLSSQHLINGQLVPAKGSKVQPVIDPATEARIGEVTDATMAEINIAVAAATAAQQRWRKSNYLRRAELLHEAARRMRQSSPLVGEMLTREMGKPYQESVSEIGYGSTATDYYAEVARHEAGRVFGPIAEGQINFTTKDPLGVVVVVLPFNFPIVLLCWQTAAAIACGNAVIIKPSEVTTLTTLQFVEAFSDLPPGLLQVVGGGGDVGKALVEHEHTDMVAFTGSVPTGRAVAETCGRMFKRSLIETSGNDPFIVMPSAPIDIAARGGAFAAYVNCGQVCTSAERFYVHEKVYAEFTERLANHARRMRIGNGLEPVDMGPMATERELRRYLSLLEGTKADGVRVVAGGERPQNLKKGWFADATVLADVAPDARIMNTESFGPVAPLCPVSSFEEAIKLANHSKYALGATIYTADLNEALRAVEEIEAGMVWINAPLFDNDAGPFGGRKQSGMGRQLGAEGLDTFRHTKFTMIDPAAKPHDWWFPYSQTQT
jgi:acyl-CoA reductase-like NAD-dependent aldehyde dehydrogenase